MEGSKKVDFSLLEDEKLRPWTKLEALDEAMDKELLKLSKTISNSPQKSAGLPGQSSLDVKNPELEAFRSFVSQPRWIDKIGEISSTTNTNTNNIKPASSGKGSNPSSPMKLGALNVIETNTTPIDANACNTSLLSAIDELSKSNLSEEQMQLVQKIQQLQLQQQQQQFSTQQHLGSTQSTHKTRRPKTNQGSRITRDMLKAVEYKPRKGPAVLNISAERYQAMMKYFAARAMPKSSSQPSLITTAQQEDLLEALVQSEIEEALRQHSEEELASLEAFLQQQYQQEQESQGKQGDPQEATSTEEDGVATDDASNANAQLTSATSTSTLPSILSSNQPQTQTMPSVISPIKTLQSSASAPILSAGRLNLSDELIRSTSGELKKLVDPCERGPRDVSTAATSKTKSNNNNHHVQISPVKSNFKSSHNQGTLTSSALSKLGVSPNTGTISNSFLCTRMKDIKTFRDQLLTGTGAYKPSDPRSKVSEEDLAKATQDMIKAVVDRNRTDSTWTLLATPGYYESRGPAKIFVSETISVHKSTESFEEHIRTMDKSRGLKRDDITEWVENAAKNKMKMFEPSGTIKM